jgi:structural maintenance of chromosome 4
VLLPAQCHHALTPASLPEHLKKTKPNPGVLKEYRKREEDFLRRAKDLDDTTLARDAQKQSYDALCKQRLDQFMNGFNTISLKLKEMYQVCVINILSCAS